MERDIHELLVLEIEKRPCLYNSKTVEYGTKQDAWEEVAASINLPVGVCKEKWRNVRSTFIRSLKPPAPGSRQKRTYYLTPYLDFIVPFSKICTDSSSVKNNSLKRKSTDTVLNDTASEHEESKSLSSDEEELEPSMISCDSESEMSETKFKTDVEDHVVHQSLQHKRKLSEIEHNFQSNLEQRQASKRTVQGENKSMKLFLLSLLSEFDSMNEHQMRKFKIQVLQLISNLKEVSPESQQMLSQKPLEVTPITENITSDENGSTEIISNKQLSTLNKSTVEDKPKLTKDEALKSANHLETFALFHEDFRLIGLTERISQALKDFE